MTSKILTLLSSLLAALPAACQHSPATLETARTDLSRQAWHGPAISYSGYRRGQSSASGVRPSLTQVTEDLRILARTWRLIRLYAADAHSQDVLEVIRRDELGIEVMLGIWLSREPGAEKTNAAQIEAGIRLAREYEDIVVAVNVGNEVLVEWTQHPVPEERVILSVRRVKAAVSQPVTVADNYVWWRDFGADLAREVDFITLHTYPLWERRHIDQGLAYTIENYRGVRAAHPDKTLVIGEAGWATYTEGNLHVPRGGDEHKQKRYYEELSRWARETEVTVFWFEAFDEPWKGTGTEGHWGLFDVDRHAKLAMHAAYPELVTDAPTSPAYPEHIEASGPALTSALRPAFAAQLEGASINPLGPGLSDSGTAPLDDGTALRLVLNGESWAGVYVLLGEYDASAEIALAMRLRLPADVARLELKLEGPETRAQSVELMAHVEDRDASGWTRVRVPLSAFDGVDLARLAVLGLWNPSDRRGKFVRGELLVDDLRFEAP